MSYRGRIATNASQLPVGADIDVLLDNTTITTTIKAKRQPMKATLTYEAAYEELKEIAADIEARDGICR